MYVCTYLYTNDDNTTQHLLHAPVSLFLRGTHTLRVLVVRGILGLALDERHFVCAARDFSSRGVATGRWWRVASQALFRRLAADLMWQQTMTLVRVCVC